MAEVFGVIVAAGRSSRMGQGPRKQFRLLAGRPILAHTLDVFEQSALVQGLVLVVPPGEESRCREEIVEGFGYRKILSVVPGGEVRQDSVLAGLSALPPCGVVLIHDAVRPFITEKLLSNLIGTAREVGAAAPAVMPKDTVREAGEGGLAGRTLIREGLRLIQTPQAFNYGLILRAHHAAREAGFTGTDDTSLVEYLGHRVAFVEGDYRNFKLTTPEDFLFAQALIGGLVLRTGIGYDVHRLTPDRKLILGGVEIPYERGLLGHSDADVLIHAIMDALLGAAGLGDIGQHFPDTDPTYEGVSSLDLLSRVGSLLHALSFQIVNIDAVIIAQAPRLAPYIPQMRDNLTRTLGLTPDLVNIKATTTEGLGFAGTGEGIAAQAVATLQVVARS
ncbi:MAG: 2-C-methyl-D-erythritol 4-phosphate cytidylyltransferase [Clostridia bacterium]|nr:2-C-methyl-D-erythritol 4-phosphate cytidylyltransferase [Clostridia bacterium]MDQ7792582.1 2-C-methyl-D-erythritol 4-phosphate cytidylyltransferase [Clostridia bacterium]